MNKTYIVGRSQEADIRISREHDTVGKMHIEITVLSDGSVCVTDRRSANGTSVRSREGWQEIHGTKNVSMDAELMLGDYRTTVRDLLKQVGGRGQQDRRKGTSIEPVEIRRYPSDPGAERRR